LGKAESVAERQNNQHGALWVQLPPFPLNDLFFSSSLIGALPLHCGEALRPGKKRLTNYYNCVILYSEKERRNKK